MTALPAQNLLGQETSPYLLQHKDNPVHWRAWGPEALAEARETGKPIFLSSGYAACHWCHVMAHESFEDAAVAGVINENFVAIKIDREERPELDQIFQTALSALGSPGGWPLSMFLTSDGEPFAGGTYFPPVPNFGRPSFRDVLNDVIGVYRDKRDDVTRTATEIRAAFANVWEKDQPKALNPNIVEPLSRRLTQRVDLFFGGFEGAPKFPQAHSLNFIWRAYMRSAAQPFGNAVMTSLDNMCQGGIYDHVGGGFARYSVDERWLVPHFEKMLYDNAALVELMTLVWQHTRSPLYAARIDETVDFVLREMLTADGAFASSIDADSEGEEGKFYTWTEAEIDDVLGASEAPFFKQVYSVGPNGNWEGKSILHRLGAMGFLRPDQEAVLTRNKRMLLMARAKRVRPALDDKVLADWNGMMIGALVQAGAVFRKPEWHFAAVRAFWMIAEKMGEENKLYHVWRGGRGRTETTGEGYAQMARAAMLLFEVSADPRYLEKARAWMARLDSHFRDAERGGYFLSSSDLTDVSVRVKTALDNATPNWNGVAAEVLARLYFTTGEQVYRDRSNATIAAFGAEIERQGIMLPTLLGGMEYMVNGVQIIIVGDERAPETQALVRAVFERSSPTRSLMLMKPGQKLHATHPAFGKGLEGGKPTAYVCVGTQCSQPITNPQQLANGLFSPPFAAIAQAQAQQRAAQGPAANSR